MNPFRYRGYVYDDETGMYYLRSRYYYPELQRFINADALLGQAGTLLSHNLFAYCGNNPISRADFSGGMYVSLELYTIAYAVGSGKVFDFTGTLIEHKITDRMRSSQYVKDKIAKGIKSMAAGQTVYENTEQFYWNPIEAMKSLSMADLDLASAIGDITLTLSRENKDWFESLLYWGGKYKVTYTGEDGYDFAEFQEGSTIGFVVWINNHLGYYPQEQGILNKYLYTCTGSFYVYVY